MLRTLFKNTIALFFGLSTLYLRLPVACADFSPLNVFNCSQALARIGIQAGETHLLLGETASDADAFIFPGEGLIQNRRAGFGLVIVTRRGVHCERLPETPNQHQDNADHTVTQRWALELRLTADLDPIRTTFSYTHTSGAHTNRDSIGSTTDDLTELPILHPNECAESNNPNAVPNRIILGQLTRQARQVLSTCNQHNHCNLNESIHALRACARVAPELARISDRDVPELLSRLPRRPEPAPHDVVRPVD